MTCAQVRANCQAWLDRALDPGAACALEAHLGQCAPCRQEAEARLRLNRALLGEELMAPPPGMAGRIVKRLATQHQLRQVHPVPAWLEMLTFTGVAAVSMAVAFVGLGVAQAAGLVVTTSLAIGVLAAAASLSLAGASCMYYEL